MKNNGVGAFGGPDFATAAIEQGQAEFGLELEDLAAQRRLADLASVRRAAEMSVIGERDDVAQIVEGHAPLCQ